MTTPSSTQLTLTVAEVATALNVSRDAVYDAVRREEIPNVGVGRTVRIPRVWLDERLAGPKRAATVEIVGEGTFT